MSDIKEDNSAGNSPSIKHTNKKNKKGKSSSFNDDKVDHVKLKQDPGDENVVLDFPVKEVETKNLPTVTIITPTRHGKNSFHLAIDNWRRTQYPADKITWLVIDDSSDIETSPIRALKAEKDKRILFYHEAPKKEGDVITYHTTGYKLNLAIQNSPGDIIAIMNENDYIYNDSIFGRICTLVFYKKQCVYSPDLGVYDHEKKTNYMVKGSDDNSVPERSMLFTKVWWESRQFSQSVSRGESFSLISKREQSCIKMPFFFNLICTKIKGSSSLDQYNQIETGDNALIPMDFYQEFPKSFKQAIEKMCKPV